MSFVFSSIEHLPSTTLCALALPATRLFPPRPTPLIVRGKRRSAAADALTSPPLLTFAKHTESRVPGMQSPADLLGERSPSHPSHPPSPGRSRIGAVRGQAGREMTRCTLSTGQRRHRRTARPSLQAGHYSEPDFKRPLSAALFDETCRLMHRHALCTGPHKTLGGSPSS